MPTALQRTSASRSGAMRRRSTALGDFLRLISVFFRNLPLPILRQLSKKVVLEQRGKDEEQVNAHTLSAKHIIYIRAFARHTLGKPSRSIAFFTHNFINSSSYVHGPIVSRSFIVTFQAFPKAPETYIFTGLPHSFSSFFCKERANEGNENSFSNCRVQPCLRKDKKTFTMRTYTPPD